MDPQQEEMQVRLTALQLALEANKVGVQSEQSPWDVVPLADDIFEFLTGNWDLPDDDDPLGNIILMNPHLIN